MKNKKINKKGVELAKLMLYRDSRCNIEQSKNYYFKQQILKHIHHIIKYLWLLC